MKVLSLELIDFRNYKHAEILFGSGLTALLGANGQGKTNLLEAISVSGGLGSIRGTPNAGLVRSGANSAVLRCCVLTDREREVLIETELFTSGRSRAKINKQNASRQKELLNVLTLTVFSPDDLILIKGPPSARRNWIDNAAASVCPDFGFCRAELERSLRQRNTLLKQISKKIDKDTLNTLDVWDAKLAKAGDEVRKNRTTLLERLAPKINKSYQQIAGQSAEVSARYESSWGDESLLEALLGSREIDLRRTISTVGPHRDEIEITINNMPARTHASQGEQRSLALALRLAVDSEVREQRQVCPVLLLDDAFSELDKKRASVLLEALPRGQRILTSTTIMLPNGAQPEQTVWVCGGILSVE